MNLPAHLRASATPVCVALFGEVLADVFADRSVLGGAPYNVARHLRAFGLQPLLITRTGNDSLRDTLLAEMEELGMDSSGVQCDPIHSTGRVEVHMQDHGHRFDILPDQAYDYIHAGVTHMLTMAARPEMVYFGTLAQRNMESRLALDTFLSDAKTSADAKSPRFLDINLRAPWYDAHSVRRSLQRADIVKLNEDELQELASMLKLSGLQPASWGQQLMERFALRYLIVTAGDQGAWLRTADGMEIRCPAAPVSEFVDTVGAGDGFAAVYIFGQLMQWPLPQTMQRASAFASALCGVRGAVPATPDLYCRLMESWG